MSGAMQAMAGGGGLMPAFQAVGSLVAEADDSIVVAWPTHEANDIGLLFIESNGENNAGVTDPAGWEHVTGSPELGLEGTTILAVLWKRAASAAEGNVTAGVASGATHMQGIILTFRGCAESGNPWDAVTFGTDTASTTRTFDAATTTAFNTLVVLAGTRSDDAAGAGFSAFANANLTNISERFDDGTALAGGGGIGIATGEFRQNGSTGAATATVTSSAGATMTLALKPK